MGFLLGTTVGCGSATTKPTGGGAAPAGDKDKDKKDKMDK
jgi:hypothetical protein